MAPTALAFAHSFTFDLLLPFTAHPPPSESMAAASFESTLYYSNPAEERLRLWRMEKEPEIMRIYKEMKHNHNAELGKKIRAATLSQAYGWQETVLSLCQEAEQKELELQTDIHQDVEEAARRVKTDYEDTRLRHPGEGDPAAEIRERIMDSTSPERVYCSPVLFESIFWEGMNELPNTHRKRLELDFFPRVNALLDFHCIAFHADVDVLKGMYDDDLPKEKRRQMLDEHQLKMKALMKDSAEKMEARWAEQKERLRQEQAAGPPDDAASHHNSSSDDQPPVENTASASPTTTQSGWKATRVSANDGVRRRAHIDDPPTILGATDRKANGTHPSQPARGILKKPAAGPSSIPFVDEIPGRFNLPYVSDEDALMRELELELDERHMSELVEETPSIQRRWVTTSSQQPMYGSPPSSSYEIYYPPTGDLAGATPRSVNVGQMTQKLEDKIEKGKGRARFRMD
ncbi:hypothetical protein C8R46DRAFT_1123633 [Mycena filopes]|nr:hypothetical protein C8R46DRAFT_1123633 [Mycena filopes]